MWTPLGPAAGAPQGSLGDRLMLPGLSLPTPARGQGWYQDCTRTWGVSPQSEGQTAPPLAQGLPSGPAQRFHGQGPQGSGSAS